MLEISVCSSHLPESALHEVARATTFERLLYASPAWWGFASVSDRSRVGRFLQRTIIEWGISRLFCRMPLSWSTRPRLNCWLRSPCGLITFFDHYSLQ